MNTTRGQSAAMPSPFTPIADYGFLSNCHTGALVAPDGGVDWLCVPRFDSASVFGSLLDREAGTFRFGPYGINVPTQRVYDAGTNVLVTTWKTPSGWVVVRDALTMGPTRGPDTVTPHTRPPDGRWTPSTSSSAPPSASTARSRWSSCASRSSTTARSPATWTMVDGAGHTADTSGAGVTLRLHTDMSIGTEGGRVRARRALRVGERAFCSMSWAADLAGPDDVDDATRTGRRRPPRSGGTGSTRRGSRTTGGETRSNARPSPSRGSPTCRPERPSRR